MSCLHALYGYIYIKVYIYNQGIDQINAKSISSLKFSVDKGKVDINIFSYSHPGPYLFKICTSNYYIS